MAMTATAYPTVNTAENDARLREQNEWFSKADAARLPLRDWVRTILRQGRRAGVDVAALLETVRRQRRLSSYIVPHTGHWGGWRDKGAIRCHGIHVGGHSAIYIAAYLLLGLTDAERRGEGAAPDYQELYGRYASASREIE
jgi:hypothetical protein